MTGPDVERIIENEREWRRYMVTHIEEMKKDIAHVKVWSTVFRVLGGVVLSIFYVWVDHKLK